MDEAHKKLLVNYNKLKAINGRLNFRIKKIQRIRKNFHLKTVLLLTKIKFLSLYCDF